MTFRNPVFMSLIFLIAQNTSALASDLDHLQGQSRYTEGHLSERWSPGVSVAVGHLEQSGKASTDGGGLSLQLFGSFYFPKTFWILDAGVGFHQQYFNEGNSNPLVGLLSAGGRYQFPREISAGPVASFFIGNGESFGKSENVLPMLGLVGFKEVSLESDRNLRFGLKYLTEAGSSGGQTANYYGVVLEWVGREARSYAQSNSDLHAKNN